MADRSNVRLVRCPKCEKLLQEFPDFSVYQCGGCGTVLRAKKKAPGNDGFLFTSDEKKGKGSSEKLESLSEKEVGSLGIASNTERGSDGIEVNRRKERIFGERTVNLIGNSLLKVENKQVLLDNDRNFREEVKGLRVEQGGTEKETRYIDSYMGLSERPVDNWVRGDKHAVKMNRPEFVNLSTRENLAQFRSSAGSSRSRANIEQWGVERDEFGGFYRSSRVVVDQKGYPAFAYPDEVPSNYRPESYYGYGEPKKHGDESDESNRVVHLEQNRAELLRKLEELKDQLSRSCDVEDNPRAPVDRTQPDPYGGQDVYNISMQPSALDKHGLRPAYFNHTNGTVPFRNHHNMDSLNCYPPRHVMNEIPAYEDPYQPQMTRSPLHQPPGQYLQRPPYEYFSGQYMGFNQDPFASSYRPETFFHRPACSCYHCLNQNWHLPPRVPPTVYNTRRIRKDPINSNFHRHDNLGPQSYNPQVANPHSWNPQMHTRWASDIDSDMDVLGQSVPRRVVAAHGDGWHCHPLAGGAPFITCHNCFELLKLPRKLRKMEKNQQKMQCGACSTIMLLEIVNKKLSVRVPEETKQISAEADEGSKEVLNESNPSSQGCLNAGNINSCSEDFDNSSYIFDLTDNRHYMQSEDLRLKLRESEKRHGLNSSSEESPGTLIVQGDISHSAEQPLRDDLSPKLPGSPFLDRSYFSDDHAVGKYGQGNNSKRVDQDKVVLSKITSRQNSVKDMSVATEMEVSFNDFLHTSLSQDSVELSKEKDQHKLNRNTESFFIGLMKKSFRSTQSLENERPNVFVNGQPIPDRLVKKAEKSAGSIQPGDYWYDFQAGFWGVMGQPCLGIIPPFIEEFNYPIPTNCSCGNTSVYVNGRELHQKDLDLLASRGLPTARDKFYIIEISGRVVDEDSGKEIDGLGKLAPTVEKAKRGFGMKVPARFI
ncbi:uncharacterized protein LOC112039079 [Quercus suber]|uniref:Extra-large guanine nucleotide-binding protein 1 n=1 Tax=Quercus suber TaxID=58331 RepID=A0AAW0JF97_QUESU